MKYVIRGEKVEITEAIKKYITEKIGKLDKYFSNPEEIKANVLVRIRGVEQIVEVTIPIKKIVLRCEERDEDLYKAIDLASDKLERQLRKNKTKMMKQKKDVTKAIRFEEMEPIEEKEEIVKRKKIEMKPMSEEEAMMQMDLIDHDFFVYKDVETKTVNVIYKRKDGTFGIIETD
ncbi:ribosomal subunit interface protein [Firmicutes bacterium CAG:884]|nr:ribosome-associated translation inhibitor RaiA [Bacillota bacterium]CCY93963.1 ribosomal subunit interface protein [Firmicutes bacterium CAG:884]